MENHHFEWYYVGLPEGNVQQTAAIILDRVVFWGPHGAHTMLIHTVDSHGIAKPPWYLGIQDMEATKPY